MDSRIKQSYRSRGKGTGPFCLVVLLCAVCGVPLAALGQSADCVSGEDFSYGWGGEAELGGMYNTGNTNSRTLSGRLALTYVACPVVHHVTMEGLHASSDGKAWAERYLGTLRSEYRYSNYNYLFGQFRYEDDRFSGFDRRFTESVGVGRRMLRRDDLTLDLEIGAGVRHSWQDGTREDEELLRLAGQLVWRLRDGVRFTEDLFVESGLDSNTRLDSRSALSIELNSRLTLRLSTRVIHNTEVPEGTKRSDSLSSVNLVFGL